MKNGFSGKKEKWSYKMICANCYSDNIKVTEFTFRWNWKVIQNECRDCDNMKNFITDKLEIRKMKLEKMKL